jgi:hypothetical protein
VLEDRTLIDEVVRLIDYPIASSLVQH